MTREAYGSWMFGVRRSARYHGKRARFFENLHLSIRCLQLAGASAAFALLLKATGENLPLVFSGLVAALTAFDLASNTAARLKQHVELYRRFIELERQAILAGDPDEAAFRGLKARRLEIEADEPPIMRVLDCICHNEQMQSEGYGPGEMARISWYQRLFAHVCDIRLHHVSVPG